MNTTKLLGDTRLWPMAADFYPDPDAVSDTK